VKGTSSTYHNNFMFETGNIRQLPDLLWIVARDTRGCRCRHGARCAGCDEAGFSAGKFGQPAANRLLQLDHVHEVFASSVLGRANFWKLQRTAQIGPGATAVDDGFDAETAVDIS